LYIGILLGIVIKLNLAARDAVSLSKSPDAELNRQRSELLLGGSQLDLGEEESRIPILIAPHSAGYDLCLPAGRKVLALLPAVNLIGHLAQSSS
jgi:hypothetical protein